MHLRLDRRSQLPIHVQLTAQLTHLIQTGQLAPGARLPTVRQLAGFLRINRNTVARVFADLERDGYLSCEPGRGTFVSAGGRAALDSGMRALLSVVDEAMDRARRLGFNPAEFSAALYARAQAAAAPAAPRKVPALLVECNRPQLRLFGTELAAALPLEVTPVLVSRLARAVRRAPDALGRYPLVVTTFFHVREVRALVGNRGPEVVALLAEASLETLMRLTALPEGSRVGVACGDWAGAENLKLSVRNAGLTHVRLVTACGREPNSLRRMAREVSMVVCSSLVERRVRAVAPRGLEVLVEDRRLDPAGIEVLRRRVSELLAAPETGRLALAASS